MEINNQTKKLSVMLSRKKIVIMFPCQLKTDVTWNLDGRPLAASEAGQARGHCPYLKF